MAVPSPCFWGEEMRRKILHLGRTKIVDIFRTFLHVRGTMVNLAKLRFVINNNKENIICPSFAPALGKNLIQPIFTFTLFHEENMRVIFLQSRPKKQSDFFAAKGTRIFWTFATLGEKIIFRILGHFATFAFFSHDLGKHAKGPFIMRSIGKQAGFLPMLGRKGASLCRPK